MRGQVLIAASALVAAVMAAPQQAAAQQYPSYHDEHVAQQQYCARQANQRTGLGAVIGGLAGAVLGSQVAARGHRTDGSVVGGVAGAAAGAMIGRGNSQRQCQQGAVQGSYDPYYGQPQQQYPQQGGYQQQPYGDDSGLYGGPYQQSSYGRDYGRRNNDCRMGEIITRDPYGREVRDNVMMCRASDGQWYPQG